MKRYAGHYIFLASEEIYKQSYIELDDNDCIQGIHPLEDEIAGTVFYNGILFPISKVIDCPVTTIWKNLMYLQTFHPENSVFELLEKLGVISSQTQTPVHIYQLDGIDLLSAKLSAHDGRCDGYVQRL